MRQSCVRQYCVRQSCVRQSCDAVLWGRLVTQSGEAVLCEAFL